jgi:hypothetical protein
MMTLLAAKPAAASWFGPLRVRACQAAGLATAPPGTPPAVEPRRVATPIHSYPKLPDFGAEPGWSRYIESLRREHPGLAARIRKNKLEGQSLGFAWVTPKSLYKGLEGGILARLLSTPELNLVGTRMFSPSNAFVVRCWEAGSPAADGCRAGRVH